MNLQTIISEADVRVPNTFSTAQKVNWLNEINNEFFDVVKIPQACSATADGIKYNFPLVPDVREKNIRKVMVGTTIYQSLNYDNIPAVCNYYILNDANQVLSLNPPPPAGNLLVIYDKINTVPFLASNLIATPDAPPEYHWIYILGLCVRIAKAMNDVGLANNYENDYKSNLSIVQQNYARGQSHD